MPDQLFRVALVYRADDFGSWCKLPVAGCWLLSWLLGRSITLQYRVYSWWAQRTYCRRVDYGCVFVDCDRACVHVIIETLNCLIIAINSDFREKQRQQNMAYKNPAQCDVNSIATIQEQNKGIVFTQVALWIYLALSVSFVGWVAQFANKQFKAPTKMTWFTKSMLVLMFLYFWLSIFDTCIWLRSLNTSNLDTYYTQPNFA